MVRVSIWCLCRWPLGALLVLDCAVCGGCGSLIQLTCDPARRFPPLLCSVSACDAGFSNTLVCLSVYCLLSCHFLPFPPRLLITELLGSVCKRLSGANLHTMLQQVCYDFKLTFIQCHKRVANIRTVRSELQM
jgi:hypothetical protein